MVSGLSQKYVLVPGASFGSKRIGRYRSRNPGQYAYLDRFVIVLFIEFVELPLHLPVVQCTHENYDKDGNHDRDSLNPLNSRLTRFMCSSKGLKQTEGQRYNRGNGKQNQNPVVVCGPRQLQERLAFFVR